MTGLPKILVFGMASLLPYYALAADAPKVDVPEKPSAAFGSGPPQSGNMPGGDMMGGMGGYWGKVDANHDGAIDKKEWMASSEDRFKEFDTNGDGKISKEELQAHREKMRAHFEEMRARRPGLGMTPPTGDKATDKK